MEAILNRESITIHIIILAITSFGKTFIFVGSLFVNLVLRAQTGPDREGRGLAIAKFL